MMLKTVVENMTSVSAYVQMALLLFFSVFVSVLVREALRSRREVSRMSMLPLQDEAAPSEIEEH